MKPKEERRKPIATRLRRREADIDGIRAQIGHSRWNALVAGCRPPNYEGSAEEATDKRVFEFLREVSGEWDRIQSVIQSHLTCPWASPEMRESFIDRDVLKRLGIPVPKIEEQPKAKEPDPKARFLTGLGLMAILISFAGLMLQGVAESPSIVLGGGALLIGLFGVLVVDRLTRHMEKK